MTETSGVLAARISRCHVLPNCKHRLARKSGMRSFPCGKQIGSYVGRIPSEDSSAGHPRQGHITKQGSSLLRFLWGEAAQAAARCDAGWRRRYAHLALRRQRNIAKVAMARRLAVRLYWMWRTVGNIRSGSSSVRTRDNSVADMACTSTPSQ